MSTIVTVEGINKKQYSKNGRSFNAYNMKANGEWYGLGYNSPDASVRKGAQVEIEVETTASGFKNAKILHVVEPAPEHTEDSPATGSNGAGIQTAPAGNAKRWRNNGEKGGFPIHPLAYERTLDRRNALNVAVEWLGVQASVQDAKGKKVIAELNPTDVIEIAQTFEAYSTGDEEAKEIKRQKKLKQEAEAKKKMEEAKKAAEEAEARAKAAAEIDEDFEDDDDDDDEPF